MVSTEQEHRAAAAFAEFSSITLDELLQRHHRIDARQRAVELFHEVVATVPAYREFLADHGVDPEAIQSPGHFAQIPVLTKKNYVSVYPLAERCRGGRLEHCDMLAMSSGSTGNPVIWPRFISDEYVIAQRFEQIFHDSFRADERRTLAVVCFALGTWVGGMFTASCCRHLAAKGYPLTVITPGSNKSEIFRALAELGPMFDQVVLLGYPPFLKDVIDSGRASGVDFAPYRIKMVLAGEVFSEEWRALVGERVAATSPCYDSASLYGTADAGVLANETPLSIAIRRFLAGHPDAARSVFGESRLPTLGQYDPLIRYFEVHEGKLLFTGDNGVPLIRYNILDSGGVIPFQHMLATLAEYGFDPVAELANSRGGDRGVRDMPFVYVFGRSDFTVSYFGANIYPENVTVGLEKPGIKDWVTGKFVIEVFEDADRNRHLSVMVEMSPGETVSEQRRAAVAASIESELLRLNSEFANYVPSGRRTPRVTLLETGNPDYFPAGVKHRYSRRPAGTSGT
jgi:phenylacetate-CoA ligase